MQHKVCHPIVGFRVQVGEQAREQQVKELLSEIESLKAERGEMSKQLSGGGSAKQPHLPPEVASLPPGSPSSQTAKLAAAASLAQAGGGERWLTIGIPTVPRPGDLDYLSKTLDSIRCCIMFIVWAFKRLAVQVLGFGVMCLGFWAQGLGSRLVLCSSNHKHPKVSTEVLSNDAEHSCRAARGIRSTARSWS